MRVDTELEQIQPKIISDDEHKPIDIVFKNLTYALNISSPQQIEDLQPSNKNTYQRKILNNINGICKSSEITAILGSSGAGKTSLLNILSKRISLQGTKCTGEITANGVQYNSDQFCKFAAYVMQDDLLFETLTVRESFQFAANLRIKGTDEYKTKKVDEIIQILRLNNCQDTFIGGRLLKGVSGGERKRTSIGFELVMDPSVIFLDEPTSGLDSFTAFLLIDVLREYAQKKTRTVVFTIHQPSSDIWNLFDRIILLVQGNLIYQGKGQKEIIQYFDKMGFVCPKYSNPADYYMQIMHSESEVNRKNFQTYYDTYDREILPKVLREIENQSTEELPLKQTKNTFLYEILTISSRAQKVMFRNPILIKGRLAQITFLALFNGAIYWNISDGANIQRDVNNINGCMFFLLIQVYMFSQQPVILTFPIERQVFLKEQNSQLYSTLSYFLGKQLIEMPMSIVFPIFYMLIQFYMIELNHQTAEIVVQMILICVIQSLTGYSIGIMFSCLFNDPRVAISISPLFIAPFILFGGLFANRKEYPEWIGWIEYISPFKYSFEALTRTEYTNSNIYPDPIQQLGFNVGIWNCVYIMLALSAAFILVGYILLVFNRAKIQ